MSGGMDLAGQTFGRLTVTHQVEGVSRVGANGKKRVDARWRCRCACGTELDAFASELRRGRKDACTKTCAAREGRTPWPRNPRILVGRDGSLVGPHGRPLKPTAHPKTGYLSIAFPLTGSEQGRESVHVIVCETFHGPRPEGMEAAHENGVRSDCRAVNLSWKTSADNHADKERHGTLLYGEAHPNARFTEQQIRDIRASVAAGEPQHVVAARYGTYQSHIGLIVNRKIWRRVA